MGTYVELLGRSSTLGIAKAVSESIGLTRNPLQEAARNATASIALEMQEVARNATASIGLAVRDPLQEAARNATASIALEMQEVTRNASAALGMQEAMSARLAILGLTVRDPLQEAARNATASIALEMQEVTRNASAALGMQEAMSARLAILGLAVRAPLQEAMRPYLSEPSWTDLSNALSTRYGPAFAGYAEAVGRSVVERTDVDLASGTDDEGSRENPFVPLRLSETEARALVLAFGCIIALFAAGAAALSEEASRALNTLAEYLTFFMVLVATYRR